MPLVTPFSKINSLKIIITRKTDFLMTENHVLRTINVKKYICFRFHRNKSNVADFVIIHFCFFSETSTIKLKFSIEHARIRVPLSKLTVVAESSTQ